MQLSGCYTALVTPFRDGKVDYDTLTKILQMQIDGGVSGIVPVGTTGESPTLSMEEHDKVIEFVIKYCKGKCQIIAGAGGNSTAEAIHLSRHAAEMGAPRVFTGISSPSQKRQASQSCSTMCLDAQARRFQSMS